MSSILNNVYPPFCNFHTFQSQPGDQIGPFGRAELLWSHHTLPANCFIDEQCLSVLDVKKDQVIKMRKWKKLLPWFHCDVSQFFSTQVSVCSINQLLFYFTFFLKHCKRRQTKGKCVWTFVKNINHRLQNNLICGCQCLLQAFNS